LQCKYRLKVVGVLVAGVVLVVAVLDGRQIRLMLAIYKMKPALVHEDMEMVQITLLNSSIFLIQMCQLPLARLDGQ